MESPDMPDNDPEESSPPLGQVVWVKGANFRCLAYRDTQGKWRYFSNNEEIKSSVTWIKAGAVKRDGAEK